jgi:hypothetical protein
VCEYIFDNEQVNVVRHKVESCLPCEQPDAYSHRHAYLDAWGGVPEHHRSAGYLGGEVKLELAETWYRCSTFACDDDDDLLTDFLRVDAWGLDLRPAKLINHVELHICDRHLRDRSPDEHNMGAQVQANPQRSPSRL